MNERLSAQKTEKPISNRLCRYLAATAAAFILTSPVLAEEENTLDAQIARFPPIKIRLARNKRIGFIQEGDHVVQTCLTLSDLSTPFVVTMGWFKHKGHPAPSDPNPDFVDELGEDIPIPGVKKNQTGLDNANRHALQAFDAFCQGNIQAAQEDLKDALKSAPGSPRLHNNLGVALALLGKPAAAKSEFDLALKEKPEYAVAMANRAWLALSQDDAETALRDGEAALKLAENLHSAQRVIVRADLRLGKAPEAMKMLEVLKQSWQSDAQDMLLLGDTQFALTQYKEAKQSFSKLIYLRSGDADLLLKVAKCSEQTGDLDDAIKKARAATDLKPDMAEAHTALGKYLEQNREFRAALVQYERTLEVKPSEAAKLAVYGPYLRVLIKMNNYGEADKFSRKWVQENPNSAECHFNRAWTISQLNAVDRLPEAVSEYRKALSADPKLTSVHYNLALLLLKMKHKDEARNELESFVKAAPNDPDVNQARQLLTKLSGH